MLDLTNKNILMLVDDIQKHLVTGTNDMQINAYLVEETGPKSSFLG